MTNHRAIIKNLPLFRGQFLRVEKLKGGLTNTNFKISVGKEIYVARFAPQNEAVLGISKGSEFRNCKIAGKLGIGPNPTKYYSEYNLLLVEYISGQVLDKKLIRKASSIKKLAQLLKKVHSGPMFRNHVDLFEQARQYFATAQRLGSWMPENTAYIMESIKKLEKKLKKKSWTRPAHLDLMVANVIDTKDGFKLIGSILLTQIAGSIWRSCPLRQTIRARRRRFS